MRPQSQADDPVNVETPVFPQDIRIRDAFRLRIESHFVPAADFGDIDSTLYRPNLRLRITMPVGERGVLELTPRWETSHYDFGDTPDLALGASDVAVLRAASVSLQGAYALDVERKLFSESEKWSLLGGVVWGSNWEGDAFSEGMRVAGTLAVGYETPAVRLALGAAVASRIAGSGVRALPVASIRWSPRDDLTLRNRGRGLQLEYRLTDRFEVFTAGYFVTRRYRLRDRSGLGSTAVEWQDKQIVAGVGFEWKLSHHIRFNVEGGLVGWYQLRVRDEDQNVLRSLQADPTGYANVGVELRP